jgi:hypothetical protein
MFQIPKVTPQIKFDSLYSPFVIRPIETVSQKPCTPNGLYVQTTNPSIKGDMGAPNLSVQAHNYAQRPILNPSQYEELLQKLFDYMNTNKKTINQLPPRTKQALRNFVYSDTFCPVDVFNQVMVYIMKTINESKAEIPIYQKLAFNDTWGGEQFGYLNEQVYAFSRYDNSTLSEQEQANIAKSKKNEERKLIVNFNLYNTLRYCSTNVNVHLFYANKKYYFDKIEITSQKNTQPFKYMSVTSSIHEPQESQQQAPVPSWIYGNTIENQFFNNVGFSDPNHKMNMFIKGGVPDSFKNVLKQWEQCSVLPAYNGQDQFRGAPLFASTDGTMTNARVTPKFPGNRSPQWTVNV